MSNKVFKVPYLFIIALALILLGGFIANRVQTSCGSIDIKDIRFKGKDGLTVSALLYVPEGVNANNKAPGIVATHGYINSRETQDGFAIEFARRGYVVLAVDQSGHGYSSPPAFANGFGGIDSLKYMKSLDMVDQDNIGLEGHSMGGWASVVAAATNPAGYKSVVLASSSTGTFGIPNGTATFPRNVAVIFSKYDEFSNLMWGAPVPADVVKTDKMKKLFGTSEDIVVGKLYGSIEQGTARKLYQPCMIHPRVHFSKEGIGDAIEWMQMTLKGGNGKAPSDQVWYWKEIFTFIAMIGMILLLFPLGGLLLQTNFFNSLAGSPSVQKTVGRIGWWISFVVMIIITIVAYIWAWTNMGKGIFKGSVALPQQITTVIMFWALAVAIISLILFILWHVLSNRKKGATMANYGLAWTNEGVKWSQVGKSFLLALVVVVIAHLTLNLSDVLFTTDYRLWVFAIKPLSFVQFKIFLRYVVPFTLYFIVLAMVLHGQMRPGSEGEPPSMGKEFIVNICLTISAFVLFLILHYLPLFQGGTLALPDASLPGIVLFQYIPIFIIVSLVSTYFYRKTGHIYVGAFINGLMITWIVVAGQATHFPV